MNLVNLGAIFAVMNTTEAVVKIRPEVMIIIKNQARAGLAPVVQTVDNAIHWINRYQMDSAVRFVNGCVIRPLNN